MQPSLNLDEVIKIHKAIQLHFRNKKYDCIASNYVFSGATNRILKEKSKSYKHYIWLINKFSSIDEIKIFFITCSLNGYKDIFKIVSTFNTLHEKYKKRLILFNNLEDNFQKDISYIKSKYTTIKNSITSYDNNICGILYEFYDNKITIETLIILNELCSLFKHLNKIEKDNIMWQEDFKIISNYTSFFTDIDKNTFIKLLTNS